VRLLARHLFTLCSAASLLLCVAVCVLWVRSYRTGTNYGWISRQEHDLHHRWVMLYRGNFAFRSYDYLLNGDDRGRKYGDYLLSKGGGGWSTERIEGNQLPLRKRLWPSLSRSNARGPFYFVNSYTVEVPAWLLAILSAIAPVLQIRAAQTRRRQRRAGLCPACGYDLRASPERCPECGTMAARAKA
jgi:hypothetical protein